MGLFRVGPTWSQSLRAADSVDTGCLDPESHDGALPGNVRGCRSCDIRERPVNDLNYRDPVRANVRVPPVRSSESWCCVDVG